MATIVNTLIEGLTQDMIQARVNGIDAKPFLFGTYFPVKKVNGFVWQTLTNQLAKRNVAADLHIHVDVFGEVVVVVNASAEG